MEVMPRLRLTVFGIVEAAEAEIPRNAEYRSCGRRGKTSRGDTVVFGDDGGDAVAVHGKKLLLKRCAFCGKCGIIGKSSSQQVTS